MPTKKNHGVVFSGSVKSALRPLSPRKFCNASKRPPIKLAHLLSDGPLKGRTLYLADGSCTLPMNFGGEIGRYVDAGGVLRWEDA